MNFSESLIFHEIYIYISTFIYNFFSEEREGSRGRLREKRKEEGAKKKLYRKKGG